MGRREDLQALGPAEALRQLEDAVRRHEQRGSWKGSTHGPIADLNRRVLGKHQPATSDDQPDCTECPGERWPCRPVMNVLVDD